MTTHTTQKLREVVFLFAMGAACAAVSAENQPSPTPTPRPRALGDIKLKHVARSGGDGRVVISDANLADHADRGSVSVIGRERREPTRPKPRKTPSRSIRERWRSKVHDQKKVIFGLERKRLRIEARIDLIEDARVTARTLARLQEAEIELQSVEREIRAEKAELGRLIREARRHGAEPGWFR